jgi:hypothetical protein
MEGMPNKRPKLERIEPKGVRREPAYLLFWQGNKPIRKGEVSSKQIPDYWNRRGRAVFNQLPRNPSLLC